MTTSDFAWALLEQADHNARASLRFALQLVPTLPVERPTHAVSALIYDRRRQLIQRVRTYVEAP